MISRTNSISSPRTVPVKTMRRWPSGLFVATVIVDASMLPSSISHLSGPAVTVPVTRLPSIFKSNVIIRPSPRTSPIHRPAKTFFTSPAAAIANVRFGLATALVSKTKGGTDSTHVASGARDGFSRNWDTIDAWHGVGIHNSCVSPGIV